MCTAVHFLKYISNQSFEWFLVFWTPDHDYDLLRSIFVTLLKKLSSEIVPFYFFQRQFLQLCFKYAPEQVKIGCSKYQKLFKTLIKNIFQGMYCRAHETATLTPIIHTVGGRHACLPRKAYFVEFYGRRGFLTSCLLWPL